LKINFAVMLLNLVQVLRKDMFIPRHPVVEDQFCSYATQSGTGAEGIGGVIAYAGSVAYLKADAVNEESEVLKMAHGVSEEPFGFLMQKVKMGYHQVHPTGFYMPGDLGSSDVIAQALYNSNGAIIGTKSAPAGVAHLGIWDTVHYTCVKTHDGSSSTVTTKMIPGAKLYAAADEGKVTNSTVGSGGTADDAGQGKKCHADVVAKVVRGASITKCEANIDNVALYPIRIKLLV
jgi:hypothetical protein